jgi:hypothetical protein
MRVTIMTYQLRIEEAWSVSNVIPWLTAASPVVLCDSDYKLTDLPHSICFSDAREGNSETYGSVGLIIQLYSIHVQSSIFPYLPHYEAPRLAVCYQQLGNYRKCQKEAPFLAVLGCRFCTIHQPWGGMVWA